MPPLWIFQCYLIGEAEASASHTKIANAQAGPSSTTQTPVAAGSLPRAEWMRGLVEQDKIVRGKGLREHEVGAHARGERIDQPSEQRLGQREMTANFGENRFAAGANSVANQLEWLATRRRRARWRHATTGRKRLYPGRASDGRPRWPKARVSSSEHCAYGAERCRRTGPAPARSVGCRGRALARCRLIFPGVPGNTPCVPISYISAEIGMYYIVHYRSFRGSAYGSTGTHHDHLKSCAMIDAPAPNEYQPATYIK